MDRVTYIKWKQFIFGSVSFLLYIIKMKIWILESLLKIVFTAVENYEWNKKDGQNSLKSSLKL